MKTRVTLTFLICFAVACAARAELVVASPAVGYEKLSLRDGSDNWLSVSLVKPAVLSARVSAIGASTVTIGPGLLENGAVAPTPSGSYYVQFTSGNLAGLCFAIQNNSSTTLTLDTAGDDLTQHPLGGVAVGAAGDIVRIRPYWRVADVLGEDLATLKINPVSSVPSGPYLGGDVVQLPDFSSPGTDKLPATRLYFVSGQGWRRAGDAAGDSVSTALPPGRPFVVRRQTGEGEALVLGEAATDPFRLKIPGVSADSDFDFPIALGTAAETSLALSGLISSSPTGGAVSASTSSPDAGDCLLEFDSKRGGMALVPAHRFQPVGASWLESGTPAGDQLLKLSAGYMLRLRGARSARYWLQPGTN